VEIFMLRLASFVAFACLTLAATSFLTAPKPKKKELEEEKNPEPTNRFAERVGSGTVSFHARFSLN
jgi:hypothetical protein